MVKLPEAQSLLPLTGAPVGESKVTYGRTSPQQQPEEMKLSRTGARLGDGEPGAVRPARNTVSRQGACPQSDKIESFVS